MDLPPPPEFADAVELYARKTGRHGKLKFVPFPLNCWVVEITRRVDDPMMAAVQSQRVEEASEPVYLWRDSNPVETAKAGRQHYVGYKLDELGVTGLIEFLEKTNTLSGRGQYNSHAEAARDQAYKGEKAREKIVNDKRENVRDMAEEFRRQINKIPLLGVGIDLQTPESASGDSK